MDASRCMEVLRVDEAAFSLNNPPDWSYLLCTGRREK
jgi:hypothetical protein